MAKKPAPNAGLPAIDCHHCSVSHLCLPGALSEAEIGDLEHIISRTKPLHVGDHLFSAGTPLQALYAVRSGSVKTYLISESGEEQITGFYLSGELVGLDGIDSQHHPSFACALETSLICVLPFDQLESLACHLPSLRTQLWRATSRELLAEQRLLALLNKRLAEGRIAAFLLNLSARFSTRSLSAQSFTLPMSRGDIGNYLGLEIETVSRMLASMRRDGLITLEGKQVSLLNMQRLQRLASNKRLDELEEEGFFFGMFPPSPA